MKWSDIVQLIQSGDSVSTKFFKNADDVGPLGQVITAFANTIGGLVVVGIDRANLHFLGSTLSDAQIADLLKEISPSVSVTVSSVEKGDRKIHVLDVQMGGYRPYSYQNVIYTLDESRPWVFRLIEEPLPMATLVDAVKVDAPVSVAENEEDIQSRGISEQIPGLYLNESRLTWRQIETVSYLKQNPTIQNKIYRALYGVSHKTAHVELTDLVNRGEIVQRGMGRSTHYVTAK